MPSFLGVDFEPENVAVSLMLGAAFAYALWRKRNEPGWDDEDEDSDGDGPAHEPPPASPALARPKRGGPARSHRRRPPARRRARPRS